MGGASDDGRAGAGLAVAAPAVGGGTGAACAAASRSRNACIDGGRAPGSFAMASYKSWRRPGGDVAAVDGGDRRHRDLAQDLHRGRVHRGGVGRSTHQQRVHGGGQTVDVRRRCGLLAVEDLGSGVGGRAADGAGGPLVAGQRGDAEVDQLRAPEGRVEDVGGLDVEVRDSRLVGQIECLGQRETDLHDLAGRQRPGGQAILQRTTGEVLHDDVCLTGRGEPGRVDHADVRVTGERAHRPTLTIEPAAGAVVEAAGQDLHRNLTAVALVLGEVDGSEPTTPQLLAECESVDPAGHLGAPPAAGS